MLIWSQVWCSQEKSIKSLENRKPIKKPKKPIKNRLRKEHEKIQDGRFEFGHTSTQTNSVWSSETNDLERKNLLFEIQIEMTISFSFGSR